jgi:hypothetical protein
MQPTHNGEKPMNEFQRYSGRKGDACFDLIERQRREAKPQADIRQSRFAIREHVATQQEERDALHAAHEQRIPTPQELLLDPCTPFWASDVIRVALQKDACDAANVFDLLAKSFDARLKTL